MLALPTVITIVCGVISLLLFLGYLTPLGDEKWYKKLSGVIYGATVLSIAIELIGYAGLWSSIVQVECALFLLIQYALEIDS